jgi:hypothetical protein
MVFHAQGAWYSPKKMQPLMSTVRLARLWPENSLSKVHRSVTLAHAGEVCMLSHANISVTNILLFKNWMHFFVVVLACKSVDRSTFCMKRDSVDRSPFCMKRDSVDRRTFCMKQKMCLCSRFYTPIKLQKCIQFL